jgi:hypothetical protein
MYALLTALVLSVLPSDLSNHWRWSSASVNQSEASPIPPDIKPIPNPTPNPVPVPPNPIPQPTPIPNILKPGDDCPKCNGGYIPSDGSAKVKCWQCEGDGIVNEGDPILTIPKSLSPPNIELPKLEPLITPEIKNGKSSNSDKTTEKTEEKNATPPTTTDLANESNQDKPDEVGPIEEKQVCYKPIYSDDGYYIWDREGKQWVRSAKQPPITKQVATGHWETRTYQVKVCNGRRCHYEDRTKQVWVSDGYKKVTEPSKPRTSYYPVRGSWWTGCKNYKHFLTKSHSGKFNEDWLKKLSWEELQSLHSDHHEELRYGRAKVKWEFVNK